MNSFYKIEQFPVRMHCYVLVAGLLLGLGACTNSGVEERNLNNNGSGVDRDGTLTMPDTLGQQRDAIQNGFRTPSTSSGNEKQKSKNSER